MLAVFALWALAIGAFVFLGAPLAPKRFTDSSILAAGATILLGFPAAWFSVAAFNRAVGRVRG